MTVRNRHNTVCIASVDTEKPQVIGYNGCRLGLAAEKQVVPLACLHLHWGMTTRDGGFMDELCLEGEEWRDVVGYEGYYQVSNLGRVRSVDREFVNRIGYHRVLRGRIMKQTFSSKYYRVGLSKGNHVTRKIVHRLVAEAFIPRIEGKDYVDHINADTKDNRTENLRWVTMAENNRHIHELGHFNKELARKRMKERNAKNGTPIPPKRVVRDDGVVFDSISAAAAASGAWMGNVSKVAHGIIRQTNGHSFKFVDESS